MSHNHQNRACSWSQIKQRLDPAWNYVLVETAAASSDAAVFDTVLALLSEHFERRHFREICRESSSGKVLLLVQIDPRQTEAVKRTLLAPRMPPSVTVYFYHHFPEGDTG